MTPRDRSFPAHRRQRPPCVLSLPRILHRQQLFHGKIEPMNLTLRIPDEIVARLGATGPALERQALEAFVVESFRAGRMTTEDLRKALGFEVLNEVDGFLKAHGVYEPYTVEEINRQVETLAKLGY